MAKKQIINNDAITVRVAEGPVESVLEAGEAVVESVEHAAEKVVETAVNQVDRIVTVTKNNPLVLAGVFIVGAAVGGFATYKYVEKRLVAKFEAELTEQIAAAKAYRRQVQKEGEFESPESAVQALVPAEVVEAVSTYQGREKRVPYNKPETIEPPVEVVVEKIEVQHNVFVEAATDPRDWDYNAEIADRELNPNKPYAISFDEHNENSMHHEQVTFTYYEMDETLADEQDKIVDNIEYTVGIDNLQRFGHGSHDANVVYVRNEALDLDFEIVKSRGSYKVEVLGMTEETDAELRHSRSRRPNRRSWREDE